MSEKREIALEAPAVEAARMRSPSAARNREPIRKAFLALMPHQGTIVEIGSGTGEHAVHIAAAAPLLFWRPGDPDAASRTSIAAWTAHFGLENVDAPHAVDVTKCGWETAFSAADGVVSINMIHIAPFAAAEGLVAGSARLLKPGGRLFLYGPFSRRGVHTAPSNAEFDAALRARDPRWGVRDLDREIAPLAERAGLALVAIVPMPANNLSVAFQKAP
jgi:cyclopropane fatty-acyl-phospholipid synthase-like methyltransferase